MVLWGLLVSVELRAHWELRIKVGAFLARVAAAFHPGMIPRCASIA